MKIRTSYVRRGSRFPRRKKTSKFDTIVRMLSEDTGPRYGRCKRIADKLGIDHHYVIQTRYDAKNNIMGEKNG